MKSKMSRNFTLSRRFERGTKKVENLGDQVKFKTVYFTSQHIQMVGV